MEEHIGNTVRTKRYVGNCEHVTETDAGSGGENFQLILIRSQVRRARAVLALKVERHLGGDDRAA